jgi:GT2 family glycosyltransferase
MSTDTPLISIIAVNYNTTAVTCDFLRSIREQNTYPHIEVILVDNGSKEDGSEQFKAAYPGLVFIPTGKNLGFSGGNNAGIRQAKGDYFFLVNNDTEFTPGLIEGLLEIFRIHPDAGMASPKFHYYFHKGTIEYAGYNAINMFTGRNSMIGSKEKDEGQYNEVKETNYAHGGAMMVPRHVVEKAGMLHEPYFLYYEELDWSEQIKKRGYKIYYQPRSLIYHKESMSTGKASTLKTFYLTRNRILFMRRNAPTGAFLVFMLYFFFFTMPKNSLMYLLRGQRDFLVVFWKGILWHFNPSIRYTK